MRELGPIAQKSKKDITDKIYETIQNGKYKDINDIRQKEKDLNNFCSHNNLKFISYYQFSSQFTNDDYLNLLMQLEKEERITNQNENKIVETQVNNVKYFDYNNGEQRETLTGIGPINEQENAQETYEQEKKFEKNVLNTEKISQVDTNQLNNEQIETYNVALENAIAKDNVENTKIIKDEYGNITDTIQVTNDSGNSYYTVDEINGSKDLVGHEASETKSTGANAKVKVKTKTGIPNISSAFANTLILSFIIGSFFGIIFLAIYIKVMH